MVYAKELIILYDHSAKYSNSSTGATDRHYSLLTIQLSVPPLKSLFDVASCFCGCCVVLVLNDVSVS